MIDETRLRKLSHRSTLSELYAVLVGEFEDLQKPRTLREYEAFVKHWQRITGDPPLEDIAAGDLLLFRDQCLNESWTDHKGKLRKPLSPARVATHYGTFRKIMKAAQRLRLIDHIPQLYVTRVSVLTPEQSRTKVKTMREAIGADELQRMFHGSTQARFPLRIAGDAVSDAYRTLLWRSTWLVLLLYALRTSDAKAITFGCVDPTPLPNAPLGLLKFAPVKLQRRNRLQALPITPLFSSLVDVLRVFFRSCHGRMPESSDLLLPHLSGRGGNYNRPVDGKPYWNTGWRSAMQRDICAPQGIVPTMGPDWFVREIQSRPDALPSVTPQVFRQSAVTLYNGHRSDTGRRLGQWIAGHSGGSVDAAHYDKPTAAVREAMLALESDALPPCFAEYVGDLAAMPRGF